MAPTKRILLLASLDARANFTPLEEDGFTLAFSQDPPVVDAIPQADTPDLLVVDMAAIPNQDQRTFLQRCKSAKIPILAVVTEANPSNADPTLAVEDFIFHPFTSGELRTRVRRILWRTGNWDSGQLIHVGDLVIDQERYEVSVDGRRIMLTFKEYQLLSLLATNPGRVYSRETLLSRVWEYDYFGGTRTVDVHIRRLRSKIEDASHLFIETVRNVGYRFRVA